MPHTGELRSKKSRLADLVVSRKRKLSQLYYLTVSYNAETTHDNEVEFLNANDIEKGRFFDESTLPSRPRTSQHQRNDQSTQTSQTHPGPVLKPCHDSELSRRSSEANAAPPKPAGILSLPKYQSQLDENGQSCTDGTREDGTHGAVRVGTVEGSGVVDNAPKARRAGDYSNPMDVDDLIDPSVPERSIAHPNAQKSPERPHVEPTGSTSRLEDGAWEPRSSVGPDGVVVQGALHHTTPSQDDTLQEKRESPRSPPPLPPLSTAADPQSSPASSNAPGSANTPDPNAGSPTTSPGDEELPFDSNKFRPKIHASHASSLSKPPGESGPEAKNSQNTPSATPPSRAELSDVRSAFRKPTMRIDTSSGPDFKLRSSAGFVESPGPLTSTSTPRRAPIPTSASHSPADRVTRISSGAIRHRSVSEILGETPKPCSPLDERPLADSPASLKEASQSVFSQSRIADRKERERERSKLSTVIFTKPSLPGEHVDSTELLPQVTGDVGPPSNRTRDYLHTLFESKAYSPPRSLPLTALLQSAHKTLSTADHLIEYQEQMNCRTLKRIYQLQNANRWPLRQLQRAAEPSRPTSHWDFLLDHAKWLRTDFREERKWKLAAACGVAEMCSEWVMSSPEERKQLQVKARPPRRLQKSSRSADIEMHDRPDTGESPTLPTPDLIPSAEDDSVSDGYVEDPSELRYTNAPAAIFSLGPSDFHFTIDKTPAVDKLLSELPLYEPVRIVQDLSRSDLAERRDAQWKKDILPISRFATGKIRFQEHKPPHRRSRYDYDEESSTNIDTSPLPPEQTDVALFLPENKHIRDRIHPGHSFRPPSEFPMPSQAFFESRSSSQWTHVDDDELRKLVKDYSYNWSLISSCLSPHSTYLSGAERRTPWECFERWIGLEGLPADMSKTPYFRAYHSRIEAAGRHILAQQEAAQRQAGNNVQVTPRKRTTQPVRVERKRGQKHLAMLDAMRKLAKKREMALQKQQHAADLAAMRKVNEANQPRPPISTPAEFSRLKHERGVKMAERQEMYRQQVVAHQKAAMQQRNIQLAQTGGAPNGASRAGNGVPNAAGPSATLGALPNGHPLAGAPNQVRPPSVVPGMPNGNQPNAPLAANMVGVKGMTPAQIQANLAAVRGMPGHSPENMRILMEAQRLQQQQQYLAHHARQAQQAASQNGPHSSPNMANASAAVNGASNPALVAAFGTANGAASPSGNAGSPRMNNAMGTGQALSSGHTPAISKMIARIQAHNPDLSLEEVQRIATQQLKNEAVQATAGHVAASQQAQRAAMNQAALNAAAGAVNAAVHVASAPYPRPQGMMTNEQVQAYNMQLRQQQALQRANVGMQGAMGLAGMGAANGGVGMVGGMTGSPVLNMARPVSQHAAQGHLSRSATPRDQRSGSNGVNGGQGSPRGGPQGMPT